MSDLSWLVADLVRRVPGVAHAVAVSADGLLIALSEGLPRDRADQVAAIASGLVSLASGAARCFEAGGVVQTVIEMDGGLLLIMSISTGSALVVLSTNECDIEQVAFEMALLVERVGHALTPALRAAPSGSPPR
jgi:uncharacterized protein